MALVARLEVWRDRQPPRVRRSGCLAMPLVFLLFAARTLSIAMAAYDGGTPEHVARHVFLLNTWLCATPLGFVAFFVVGRWWMKGCPPTW